MMTMKLNLVVPLDESFVISSSHPLHSIESDGILGGLDGRSGLAPLNPSSFSGQRPKRRKPSNSPLRIGWYHRKTFLPF